MNLREPGAVLLISCYELGHQPAGIAFPMAFLEADGYRPHALDIAVENFDAAKAAALFVGISVPMHTALRLGVRVAERVRSVNPNCHICFYGLYAALNSDYLLTTVADSTIGGEFETSLIALCQALQEGTRPEIEGVSYRDGFRSGPRLKKSLFPTPRRGHLPSLEHYARLEYRGNRELAGYAEATRGCLHHCLHCPWPPVYDGRFFVVPAQTVIADVRGQIEQGARHITFGDPDFLNGPAHSLRIARLLHEEFPQLTFDFTAKVEHLLKHQSLLPEMARLGCLFIVTAAESLSAAVLKNLHKGHTPADVVAALEAVRRAGICFRPTWVAFTPWTGLQDYLEMLDFIEREDLIDHVDAVQYSIRLLVPPGSRLLQQPAMKPHLLELDQASFSYRWKHPDRRMEQLYCWVTELVRRETERSSPAIDIFHQVQKRVFKISGAGRKRDAGFSSLSVIREQAARLTEPWFC
ncbi:MAG TPA: CUAEP/CCAEP-tail radical SAM protein [Acidobacteriota bacterium]|jgi:radical SAM superfamily enzyme YgiQ (UPF0313 family)